MNTVQSVNSSSDVFAAINAQSRAGTADASSSSEEVQNRFLKLLVTQLKNQDPLNPLDNAAVTTQISQISTVTGIENLNATMQTLLSNFNDGQSMQAAGLLGKRVLVPGSRLALSDGEAGGGANLAGPADKVTLSILDAAGKVVQSRNLGAREAGSFSFTWDGQTDAGTAAPPGNYSFSITAVRGSESVAAETMQLGTVSALVRDKGAFQLELAGLGRVDFNKVQQIF
ncbi:MAG: Basal-body rod modification protein FlgD [Candidatus Accumulibacter phosphatis]|uniref:Basal-body rod modification protein FlgD n=1 Tax=Candidatus Accumulibacter phosphatis TaxID=327160 RepID=A0A080M1D7_9PROT|nr:flagellar hook assembly protein FlgD [Accumulibacter sp.]KFB74100.1 MAG: Basal-body rod modification protein FlgD [Candidatus Accumulibacter phosphatis]HRF13795.1 flagellar hook assembly protein FlgD [Candidatus Accumulibacter phosphatis]